LGVGVDGDLDGSEQVGNQLRLVDDHQAIVLDKVDRVVVGSLHGRGIIEQTYGGARTCRGRQPRESAFPSLSRAVDRNDSCVEEGLVNKRGESPRDEFALGCHGQTVSSYVGN